VAVSKVIALDPEDGSAYVLRGQINQDGFHQLQRALADFERASEIDPIYEKATLARQWEIMAELGMWVEALLTSQKLSIMGSQDPLRYFYRGWSLIQLGRIDDAIQMLFFGIERYPDYPVMLYYGLGMAYYERQAWSQMVQALEVALLQTGDEPAGGEAVRPLNLTASDILAPLGLAYLELQQCETGGAIIERAIAESPDPPKWRWVERRIGTCFVSLTPTPTPEEAPLP
jgi:tetratricopeptide (TPR) repeat protein